MKIKSIFAFTMLLFIMFMGCKNVPSGPVPVYIRAGYQVSTFLSPCGPGGTYIESQTNANGIYTFHNYCDGGAYGNTQNSNATSFNSRTYADDYMAATTDGGAYADMTIPLTAPAGTIKCYGSADNAHIVCDNSAGVITYREEHPSVHGILDADGSAKLVFYDESSTPF